MGLGTIQQNLLELAQEGRVCATSRIVEGRRIFVAAIHATEEDKEFTKVWLEDPSFGLDS